MSREMFALLLTLLLGVFILIGAFIILFLKKKDNIIQFSIGLALGVIVMLGVIDLIPEVIENLGLRYIYIAFGGCLIGYFLLKLLDKFIPDHHEDKMNKKEANSNLIHIGIVTSIALILHNLIEGIAVYSSCVNDTSVGLMLAIGVGFHNIPLGMVISSSFYHSTGNVWKTLLVVLVVSLSTFVGGVFMFLLNINTISEVLLGGVLSITLGMLAFIVIDELIPRIINSKNKKYSYIGIGVGILILIVSLFI